MFLSRLTLNLRNPQVRVDLGNPYELHRTLTKVWDNAPNSLYRLEERIILAQTLEQPDWSRLPEGYLVKPAESRPLQLEVHLDSQQPLRFRLRGNPVVAKLAGHRTSDGKRRTKRYALLRLEDQLEWLQRQGRRCGFTVVGAMVSDSGFLSVYKRSEKCKMVLYQATFDGHLRVSDPERFAEALRTGVGHGKSWGLGMVSI